MILWTPSLLFFICAVEAAVTVYTTATTLTSIPQYTAASTDQSVLQVPSAPTNQAASVQLQLYDGGMDWLGLPVVSIGFHVEECQVLNGIRHDMTGRELPWVLYRVIYRYYFTCAGWILQPADTDFGLIDAVGENAGGIYVAGFKLDHLIYRRRDYSVAP